MDGDVLSLSSSSSLSCLSAAGTHRDTLPKSDSSLAHNQQEHPSTEELWTELECPVGDRLLSTEEQVTLITESMTVTSTDQEKLLLLNRNTELRRVNKELMKLNQDWDQVYRSATLGLQHRLEAVELENTAIKQLNSRLLLKVEHQQSAKQYYEQALMHELKKNQELQEYITLLESRRHLPDKDCTPAPQDSFSAVIRGPVSYRTSHPPGLSPSPLSDYNPPSSSFFPAPSSQEAGRKGKGPGSSTTPLGDAQHEVKDLKEQLEALRCQTQIYEAEYETEHNDHKHTQQENRRLRKKREETRQQVALLQEQLKVYEDDFQRERSDKQMLQRLLLKKNPASSKDPVLIHRCNNEQQPLGGDKRTQSGDRRKQHHPFCPNHPHRDKESD